MTWVFGEEEFHELLEKQNYYLVEFADRVPLGLFGHFAEYQQAWPIYKSKFYPDGYDEEDFRKKIAAIDEVINRTPKYKFFYALRDNDVFMINEFRRICYLLRDVYRRGTFHYPCTFWSAGHDRVNAHPGNHLLYSLLTLGKPIRCLFTVRKDQTEEFFTDNTVTTIIKKIQSLNELQRVLGRPYKGWLQDDFILNPAIVVEDADPKWQKYDVSGFLQWPHLMRVAEWAAEQWWYDWFPKVCEGEVPISQHVVVKRGFPTKDIMFGNLLGFLLNSDEVQEDGNFALINVKGKVTKFETSIDPVTTFSTPLYWGNRWTPNEKTQLGI